MPKIRHITQYTYYVKHESEACIGAKHIYNANNTEL